jgi:uncharacterized lipoprotein YddW (UPF0748 family)
MGTPAPALFWVAGAFPWRYCVAMFQEKSILRFVMSSLLLCQTASAAGVVLVKGTSSTPNAAEKNYADTLNRNLDRLLTEMNISHDVIDDDKVGSTVLADAKVVILGDNPFPLKKEVWALKTYLDKGGKLIVFYCANPDLAEAMNMKLDQQLVAPKGDRWNRIRFNGNAPPNLPDCVVQESRIIRPVLPVKGKSKVIAWWEDAAGKDSGNPAWVQSDHGFWMSHVLLDDNDVENKKLMLLGLVAALDPSVWRPAATRYYETACDLDGSRTFADAVATITAMAKANGRELQADSSLSEAASIREEISPLLAGQKYPAVVQKSRTLKNLLIDAYAVAQRAKPDEFRAVWERTGVGLYPGDWNKTCRVLRDNGFTDLIANMAGSGLAHYKSKALKKSEMFDLYGDQLAQCVTAAHGNDLKVHAWAICWKFDDATENMIEAMRKQGRLQISDTGRQLNWLCPTHPANRKLELDNIREMAGNYHVDGIHLDYIRFKDAHYCYCQTCKAAFEKQIGRTIDNWPAAVKDGELRKEFFRWRCNEITGFVRDAAIEARKLNPGIKMSAAVFGKYPSCVDGVGQDWASWLKNDYVDFVCPMNYTNGLKQFKAYVNDQISLPSAKGRVFPGIGVTATESRLDPVEVIDQIVATRKEGASGFVLFDLDRGLEKDYLPLLRLGVTETSTK